MTRFEDLCRSGEPARDKFLSRLFGLFSEEVVRAWCRCPEAAYEHIGRPTLRAPDEPRGHTLDFTLRSRRSGEVLAAEQKCELEFEGYRYLRLSAPDQIEHHRGSAAFSKFLRLARDPSASGVRVAGRELTVDGAILVWGATSEDGRGGAMEHYGFAEVLSLEDMIVQLKRWSPPEWEEHVSALRLGATNSSTIWPDALRYAGQPVMADQPIRPEGQRPRPCISMRKRH